MSKMPRLPSLNVAETAQTLGRSEGRLEMTNAAQHLAKRAVSTAAEAKIAIDAKQWEEGQDLLGQSKAFTEATNYLVLMSKQF